MPMNVTLRRKEMLAAIGKIASVIPARSPRPILQHVKFVADDAACTVSATDLEVGIRARVTGVHVASPGTVILSMPRFQQILSTSSEAEIDLQVDGDHLVVRSARSRFTLPSEDPSLFPAVPDFAAAEERDYFAVASADLRTAIRRTVFCTDPESTRYALSGCLLEFTESRLTMIATDGRRLALMPSPAEWMGGGEYNQPKPPVVPAKALKLIDKNLDDPDLTVHLTIQNNAALLLRTSDGTVTIYSRLVEGRYPDFRQVFPDASSATRIPLDVAGFRQAVEQAAVMTSPESRGLDFDFSPGGLTIIGQAADVGSGHVKLPLEWDGPNTIGITFDPRYLTDFLKPLQDDQGVALELIDHKSAAVFVVDDGGKYVAMPLTRDR